MTGVLTALKGKGESTKVEVEKAKEQGFNSAQLLGAGYTEPEVGTSFHFKIPFDPDLSPSPYHRSDPPNRPAAPSGAHVDSGTKPTRHAAPPGAHVGSERTPGSAAAARALARTLRRLLLSAVKLPAQNQKAL